MQALRSLFIVLPYEEVIDILNWMEFQSLLMQSEIPLAKNLLTSVVEGTVFRTAASLHVASVLDDFADKDLVRGDDWRRC